MGFNTGMVMNIMNILDDLGVPPIFGHPFWTGRTGQGYYPEADYLDLFEVKTRGDRLGREVCHFWYEMISNI